MEKPENRMVWLSYDLGIGGDYTGLYSWLDDRRATECGESLAVFRFDYKKSLTEELKKELSTAVGLNTKSRIYVIYRNEDKWKGKFLFGRRRGAPWAGYGEAHKQDDDED